MPAGRSASWRFPVGDSRELSARLDDAEVPVLVEEGGKFASVAVPRGDEHRLAIRRVATPQANGSGAKLDLPINPVATARVMVEDHDGHPRVEVLSARGDAGIEPGRRSRGSSGPPIAWNSAGPRATRRAGPPREGPPRA